MTIPALPSLSRASPTFRADLDALFLTQLPATTGAINDAIIEIEANVVAADTSADEAADSAAAAALSASDAQAAKDAATAAAASAVSAPGSSANSTTNLTIDAGLQVLTIQTGKLFVPGQWLVVSSAANTANQMTAIVTAHNNVTGQLTLNVPVGSFSGSGTFADWVVALTATPVSTPAIAAKTVIAAEPVIAAKAIVFSYFLA